jgi:hypothetical protein
MPGTCQAADCEKFGEPLVEVEVQDAESSEQKKSDEQQ